MAHTRFEKLRRSLPLLPLVGSLLAPADVWAQTPPDAGRILNELEHTLPPILPPRQPAPLLIEEAPRPAMTAPDTARFHVNGFRISRTKAYTEAELLPLLKDFVGRDLSLADINRAADVITRYYRERGHFVARAYVPAQDVKDGIVEIIVLEGYADKINVVPDGTIRMSEAYARSVLEAAIGAGGMIQQDNLERGLLLLNDTPGVDARSSIAPGATVGTSSITARINEGPLVTGSVSFDNGGNRFSGAERIGASVGLNDPSGHGDDAALRAIHSTGIDYGRLGYQIPVGSSGLKLGAAYTSSRYSLCCNFAALQARGTAAVSALSANYPFIRTRDYTLRGGINYEARKFFDQTVAGTTSDRHANVLVGTLAADGRDNFGGGGLINGSIALSSGNLHLGSGINDQNNPANIGGSYSKIGWNVARLQRLGQDSSLYAALAGQFASKNLDSSEKFVLGGPQGVRAYPQGEATGDEGILLNLEFRYDLSQALKLSAFVDHGNIRLQRSEWAGSATPNRYSLSGAGIGLQWSQPGDFAVLGSIAHRLGSNPGRDPVTGNDSDARNEGARVWVQAVKYF